jgi:hypothetical protein
LESEVRKAANDSIIGEGRYVCSNYQEVSLPNSLVRTYLDQTITYHAQVVEDACDAGFALETTVTLEDITRLELFIKVIKWFVTECHGQA